MHCRSGLIHCWSIFCLKLLFIIAYISELFKFNVVPLSDSSKCHTAENFGFILFLWVYCEIFGMPMMIANSVVLDI